jgi:HlyD family secretion protein
MSGMDRPIEKKGLFQKKHVIIGIAILLFIALLVKIVFGDNRSRLNVETDKISIEQVEEGVFQDYIAVIGTVEPIKTIYLDAIEGGRVDEIVADEGSMVKAGDIILKLSNTNLLLDIMFRESELAERENNLRSTRLMMEQNKLSLKSQLMEVDFNLKREERLYKKNSELIKNGSISKEEFEQSQDTYEMLKEKRLLILENQKQDSIFRSMQITQLENSVGRMHDNLQIIKKKQESLIVRAPVDGQLATIRPELGESMAQGARLGQINVLDAYKLNVEIDEHFIARVTKGLNGECEFSEKNYPGHITKIYPEVVNGRFNVDMVFDKSIPDEIRIGQTSRIRLELGESKKALLLPKGGFYQSTGGQWVYVVDKTGSYAEKRELRIGRQNPKYYEVLEGLTVGEKVITSNYEVFGNAEKLVLKK